MMIREELVRLGAPEFDYLLRILYRAVLDEKPLQRDDYWDVWTKINNKFLDACKKLRASPPLDLY